MGYRKIDNFYRDIRILDFKECYALEKIHGTSAHIAFHDDALHFFAGGEKHENFVAIFDYAELLEKFRAMLIPEITVYGESCGGKMHGMKDTYGDKILFMPFEVKIGPAWLNVDNAVDVCTRLGLGFVDYARGPATIEWINEQRDRPSSLALSLGLGEKMREGVVVRPVQESHDYRGNRIITKHKRDEFRETKSKREINPDKVKILANAQAIADEWVTPMRLAHVLDKMPLKGELEHTKLVIQAMLEDVKIEGGDEISWSREAERAVGNATARLYKASLSKI